MGSTCRSWVIVCDCSDDHRPNSQLRSLRLGNWIEVAANSTQKGRRNPLFMTLVDKTGNGEWSSYVVSIHNYHKNHVEMILAFWPISELQNALTSSIGGIYQIYSIRSCWTQYERYGPRKIQYPRISWTVSPGRTWRTLTRRMHADEITSDDFHAMVGFRNTE